LVASYKANTLRMHTYRAYINSYNYISYVQVYSLDFFLAADCPFSGLLYG
jgi:hypothetical protein